MMEAKSAMLNVSNVDQHELLDLESYDHEFMEEYNRVIDEKDVPI